MQTGEGSEQGSLPIDQSGQSLLTCKLIIEMCMYKFIVKLMKAGMPTCCVGVIFQRHTSNKGYEGVSRSFKAPHIVPDCMP